MAAITTAITAAAAAVGAGTSLYGSYQKSQGDKAAAEAAQKQAALEAARTAVSNEQTRLGNQYSIQQSATSVDFSGRDTALQIESAQDQLTASGLSRDNQISSIKAQQRNEAIRRQAMEVGARRDVLQNLRTAQIARAQGLTNQASAGAQFSSARGGNLGGISGQLGVNNLGIYQALYGGRQTFDNNASISETNIAEANLRYSLASQQADVQTREAQLKQQYAQVQADQQTSYTRSNAALQDQLAALGGQINTNQGSIVAGQGQAAYGSSLFQAGASIFSAGENFAKIAPTVFGSGTNSSGTSVT